MKHLSIYYTNNIICEKVLKKSLSCFVKAVVNGFLPNSTLGVIVSVKPVVDLLEFSRPNVINIIAPYQMLNKGHLSIIEKISYVLKLHSADFVSLHEHDVLYPEDYLIHIQRSINEIGFEFDYFAYNNLIGVNKTGYQQRIIDDFPLSTLTFPISRLEDLLFHKREEFFSSKCCFLEPGYGGSYGKHFRKLQLGKGTATPVVHVNMNRTSRNHHFTNHYLTYEEVSKVGFDEWPGDLAYIFS